MRHGAIIFIFKETFPKTNSLIYLENRTSANFPGSSSFYKDSIDNYQEQEQGGS